MTSKDPGAPREPLEGRASDPSTSSQQPSIRLLIVDDHAVTRSGVRLMAESIAYVEIVGEAGTGEDAVRLAHQLHPDAVLMDLRLPGIDGLEATRQIKNDLPNTDVLMLTVEEEEDAVFEAIRAGASGYVSKSCSAEQLRHAFDALRDGGTYMTPDIAALAMRSLGDRAARERASIEIREAITDREQEVLSHLSEGRSARAIADQLGIAERTVTTHVGNIYRKLGVTNRVDAVLKAIRFGLVDTEV